MLKGGTGMVGLHFSESTHHIRQQTFRRHALVLGRTAE